MARTDEIFLSVMDELVHLRTDEPASELCGILDGMKKNVYETETIFATRRLLIARRIMHLLKDLNEREFNAKMAEGFGQFDGVLKVDKKSAVASIALDRKMQALIREEGSKARGASCAWLRGYFAAAGSLSLPQNGYYLYFKAERDKDTAEKLLAACRQLDVMPLKRPSGAGWEFTVRDQQSIVAVLNAIGAPRSAFAIEDVSVVRSMKSRANKLVNCDTANIVKTIAAARKQTDLLSLIDANGLTRTMPPLLQELASLRREHPSATLKELGQMMQAPVSKSTVEYRWKKLERYVEKITMPQKGDGRHVLGKS